jgi:hypothetical protein
MGTSDKVVHLKDYVGRKKEDKDNKTTVKSNELLSDSHSAEPVVAIDELRERIIAEERRQVKRTLLTEFIGASVILPGSGLVRVTLNDISLNGLSFDVVKKYGSFSQGDKVALRVYLNQSTYFPMEITVNYAKELESEGVFRHGAKFTNESQNQEALSHFIKFMETVNTSLRADLGDILLSK